MNTRNHLLGAFGLVAALGTSACGGTTNPPSVTGDSGNPDVAATDTAPTDTAPTDGAPADGPVGSPGCATYCTQLMTNCTGALAQYDSVADCLAYCAQARWPAGDPGAMAGNSLNCRIYHGGVPAMMAAATHCPHAGPSGGNVCGEVMFRTTAPAMYRRVDRMGMPAVSTAVISGMTMGTPNKNIYNDVTNRDDMGRLVPNIVETLTGLHTALDRHLMAAGLTPCSMTTMIAGLPECLGQNYAPGATVASLVVPDDAINVNPSVMAGFPNGRRLADPVIDVTLAVLLLRQGSTCGMGMCSPGTLAGVPLNPPRNDRMFLDEFPYLAAAHAAP